MIYTSQVKKAMKVAFEAHKDSVDKGKVPYIFHPFYVAMQMENEKETVAAFLHDVIEDSDITLDDLRKMGFDGEVIYALSLLTYKDGSDYMEYIKCLKANEIARKVKLADLRHNSMLGRLDVVTEEDIDRCEKYAEAIRVLERK